MATSLFAQTTLAGPYRLPPQRLAAVQEEIASNQIPSINLPPATAKDTCAWLAEAGKTLAFPGHFGANFDALYDCLCDQECLAQAQLVLFIHDIRALGEESCDVLIAVLQAAADEWREQGRALWALFLTPGLDLDALPVPKA